jgi:glucan phosphoethanolaminetransferase (alkaline phosphatase superfamily)
MWRAMQATNTRRGRTTVAAMTALSLAPTLVSIACDFARRGRTVAAFSRGDVVRYLGTGLLSAAFFASLLVATKHPRPALRWTARFAFLASFTWAMGTQSYFRAQTASYFNLDAALFGAAFGKTVVKELGRDARALAIAHTWPLLGAMLLLVLVTRLRPAPETSLSRRSAWLLALPPLLAVSLAVLPIGYRGTQPALPEILAAHAVVGLAKARSGLGPSGEQTLPGRRSPEYLPAMKATPARPRNVLLVITESVRADSFCSAFDEACAVTPATNRAAPGRLPLLQMRANDSATAVSVAVLLTGLTPTSSREELHRAPTIWEYATAAGWDTAYWTSQNLLFGNSDMFVRDIGVDKRISATELDPEADLDLGSDDGELSAYVQEHLDTLREPYLAVVHYSNTHFPYLVHEDARPFEPARFTKDPDENAAFFNYYRNAVHLQDRAIARLVRAVRATNAGERTVVVFTSDHGEAFREHGQIGHTLSVYDEEIHVPAFVDAPDGTLSSGERAALQSARDRPVFHTDIVPTLLDLVGVWDAPELGRTRARLGGHSLLGAAAPERYTALTNCAAVWGCPFKNWGMMLGTRKLEARQWDGAWHCFDLATDPREERDLGSGACAPLVPEAERIFGGLPGARP